MCLKWNSDWNDIWKKLKYEVVFVKLDCQNLIFDIWFVKKIYNSIWMMNDSIDSVNEREAKEKVFNQP